jgi:hypothetical protein
MSLQDKASIVWPLGAQTKVGSLAAWNPQDGTTVPIGVVRAGPKTRVNEAGLIETVASNVLARDFTYGGCGDFTIEEQRTNFLTYSEDFTQGVDSAVNVTVTANSTTAPDGTTTANKLTVDNGSVVGGSYFQKNYTKAASSLNYSLTIYAEKSEYDSLRFYCRNASSATNFTQVYFNLNTGVISTAASSGGVFSNASATITSLIDGRYKCTLSFTSGTDTTLQVRIYPNDTVATTGDGTKGIFAWGLQLEEGAYASSYIPTVASAVTRLRDVPNLTGAGALLGNSEGGLFIEALAFAFDGAFSLGESTLTSTNRLAFRWTSSGNRASLFINVGGVGQVGIDTSVGSVFPNIFYKIAIGYATNDVKILIDGVDSGSDTSATMPPDDTFTDIRFTTETGALPFYGRIRQFIVFNQAPTDSQLAAITTP